MGCVCFVFDLETRSCLSVSFLWSHLWIILKLQRNLAWERVEIFALSPFSASILLEAEALKANWWTSGVDWLSAAKYMGLSLSKLGHLRDWKKNTWQLYCRRLLLMGCIITVFLNPLESYDAPRPGELDILHFFRIQLISIDEKSWYHIRWDTRDEFPFREPFWFLYYHTFHGICSFFLPLKSHFIRLLLVSQTAADEPETLVAVWRSKVKHCCGLRW